MFEIRPEGSEGAAMEISETRDPGKEQTQQLPVGCVMEEELRGCYGHSTVGEGRVVGAELKEAIEPTAPPVPV